jgi:hypothetical protein
MAANVKEAVASQGETTPGAVAITELPFFRARADLLQPGQHSATERKRSQDRTVLVVSKWVILNENLPMMRSQTLSCCEVSEGKGGAVVLKIHDKAKFAAVRESIASTEQEIAVTENAIRALDEMHAGFLSELHDTRTILQGVEGQQRQLLSNTAAAALQRGARLRLPPEAILEQDEIYQTQKTKCESQIATAKRNLAKFEDEITRIEAILDGVGC